MEAGSGPRPDGNNHCTVSSAEYQTSIKEKLPLIVGSSAAGLVFLIAVVVIAIVCNRWVAASGPGLQPQLGANGDFLSATGGRERLQ